MVVGVLDKLGLRRTIAEKELLTDISKLENLFRKETDLQRRKEIYKQINEFKSKLLMLSGITFTDLRVENASLKESLAKAESKLSMLELSSAIPPPNTIGELKMHGLILLRYSDLINEKEQKTVGEIKSLINKDDLTVESLARSFMPQNYSYEKDFLVAAQKAYNYVSEQIDSVNISSNISFWISPKEIVSEKIGDDEDKSILLCSLLFALGDKNAQCVIAELENTATHAFVITAYNGKFILLDPAQKILFSEFTGTKEEVLGKYSFNNSAIKRFLYKFNNSNYEQFQ